MPSVPFVSCSGQDAIRVADVWAMLKARGFVSGDAWMSDDQLRPGDDYAESIRKAIGDAPTVVVLWTESAARSPYVNYELGMADALEKPILIVDLDGRARIPGELSNVQIVDFHPAT
jgi:hypothetical protein